MWAIIIYCVTEKNIVLDLGEENTCLPHVVYSKRCASIPCADWLESSNYLHSHRYIEENSDQWRIYIVKFFPNSFNFMQFLGKFGKIVCWRPLEGWRPHLEEILDPPLLTYLSTQRTYIGVNTLISIKLFITMDFQVTSREPSSTKRFYHCRSLTRNVDVVVIGSWFLGRINRGTVLYTLRLLVVFSLVGRMWNFYPSLMTQIVIFMEAIFKCRMSVWHVHLAHLNKPHITGFYFLQRIASFPSITIWHLVSDILVGYLDLIFIFLRVFTTCIWKHLCMLYNVLHRTEQ